MKENKPHRVSRTCIRRIPAITLSVLVSTTMAAGASKTEKQKASPPKSTSTQNLNQQQKQAIAFLLGWDSKMILTQNSREDRQRYLLSIKQYVRALNIALPHPLSYYFAEPQSTANQRAQAFAEEALAELKLGSAKIANHFGAAGNVLIDISHINDPESKTDLSQAVGVLDLPAAMKQIPDDDDEIIDWAARIRDYFLQSLRQDQQWHPI